MVVYRITVPKEIKKSKMMCLGSATKSRGCGLFFALQRTREPKPACRDLLEHEFPDTSG